MPTKGAIMAKKRVSAPKRQHHTGKVGDDPQALKKVGGKGDFGIPARDTIVRAHDGEIEGRPAGSAPGYSGNKGVRTTGVGSLGGPPGQDSGGDLDTDFIGLDGQGGLAAKPPREEELSGKDVTTSGSGARARGGRAKARNAIKAGSHGASPWVHGDTVDHSGEDSSTVNPNAAGSVEPQRGSDPGAEGEISMDEATGADNY
jgi:hypothetical protein